MNLQIAGATTLAFALMSCSLWAQTSEPKKRNPQEYSQCDGLSPKGGK